MRHTLAALAFLAALIATTIGCALPDDSDLFGPVATTPAPTASTAPVAPAPSATTPPATTAPTKAPAPHLCVACDGGGCQEADDVCAAVDPEYAATGCMSGDTMPAHAVCFDYPGAQPTEQQCYVGPGGGPVCEMVQTMTLRCCSRVD
jgi:hypothetical protein